MDAFENLVAEVLWSEGLWVQTSVRVEITRDEKKLIGRPTSPRWEIDIVAYNGQRNIVHVVECKSFLDSDGVGAKSFEPTTMKGKSRYKLFVEPELRNVVLTRLENSLVASGACKNSPTIRLGLACGKTKSEKDRAWLKAHFAENNWDFWDEEWLREKLQRKAESGYENAISTVVAKLIIRSDLKSGGKLK